MELVTLSTMNSQTQPHSHEGPHSASGLCFSWKQPRLLPGILPTYIRNPGDLHLHSDFLQPLVLEAGVDPTNHKASPMEATAPTSSCSWDLGPLLLTVTGECHTSLTTSVLWRR